MYGSIRVWGMGSPGLGMGCSRAVGGSRAIGWVLFVYTPRLGMGCPCVGDGLFACHEGSRVVGWVWAGVGVAVEVGLDPCGGPVAREP